MNAPLVLTLDQTARLLNYMQMYRRSLSQQLPSTERNSTIRCIQALQGTLISIVDTSDKSTTSIQIIPTYDDVKCLKLMIHDLLIMVGNEGQSEQRTSTLNDLAG